MKKYLIILTALFLLVLTACGDSGEDSKEVSKIDKESDKTEENKEEESKYEQVLIDTDIAIVTLEGISKKEDAIFGDSHIINVSIENKSDETIVIQTDEVSVDGLMVTDNSIFSEEVAAGKKANGKITIQMYDDEELPPLDEELEMVLKVIDAESFETISDERVNIEIK